MFTLRSLLLALASVVVVLAADGTTDVELSKDVTFTDGWTKESNSCGGSDYVTSKANSSLTVSWYGE